MAIKGLSYIKTIWSFEERPVSSSKLNTWDDRIEAAFELLFFLLSSAWGAGNGVVRGAATDDLKVVARSTPALSVEVRPGYAFINRQPYKLAANKESADVAAPAIHPRIDLVQANLDTWSIAIKPGTEAASPSAPSPDASCIRLAHLYLRPGATSIKNSDDATNGYIIDMRTFV